MISHQSSDMEDKATEMLIAGVEQNQMLWEKSHRLFKDSKKNQDVWRVTGSEIRVMTAAFPHRRNRSGLTTFRTNKFLSLGLGLIIGSVLG